MDAKILLFALMAHCTCEMPDEQTSTVSTGLVHANPMDNDVPHVHRKVMEPRIKRLSNAGLRKFQLIRFPSFQEVNYSIHRVSELSVCGVSKVPVVHTRIAGGVPSRPHAWPWMAAIILRKLSNLVECGGVLISEEYILTAAHCVYLGDTYRLIEKSDFTIRLGEHQLLDSDTTSVNLGVLELIPHPLFNQLNMHHDIAFIRLSRPIKFNQFIQPICLPESDENTYIGRSAYIAGWGRLSHDRKKSKVLRQQMVRVLDIKTCNKVAKKIEMKVTDQYQICAGYVQGGKDACQGDSGGPLMVRDPNNRVTTIGVVSFGYMCGQPNYPGIYTRVSRYVPWIKEITAKTAKNHLYNRNSMYQTWI